MQVLGSESFLNIPDVNGQLLLVNGGSTGTITTGTFASRPSASTSGNLFVDNTNFVWYYDNGTVWNQLSTGPNPIIPGTASLTVPIGTTAQRPATPIAGMIRYNSTTGQIEAYDTTWQALPGIIDKSTTNVVQSGTTSTNLISYSVPANTLGINGIMRISMNGIWLSGGNGRTITITVSYGGTTLYAATSGTLANAITVPWRMEFQLAANNSATAQTLTGQITLSQGATTGVTTGFGTLSVGTTAPEVSAAISGTSAVASTSAQTFTVAVVQNGAGTLTKYFHTIEIL